MAFSATTHDPALNSDNARVSTPNIKGLDPTDRCVGGGQGWRATVVYSDKLVRHLYTAAAPRGFAALLDYATRGRPQIVGHWHRPLGPATPLRVHDELSATLGERGGCAALPFAKASTRPKRPQDGWWLALLASLAELELELGPRTAARPARATHGGNAANPSVRPEGHWINRKWLWRSGCTRSGESASNPSPRR